MNERKASERKNRKPRPRERSTSYFHRFERALLHFSPRRAPISALLAVSPCPRRGLQLYCRGDGTPCRSRLSLASPERTPIENRDHRRRRPRTSSRNSTGRER